ncbi:sensor histidine kinase [Thermomonospora umbrina]|uniref:histidine kinase n=1 Tax=Thermomonospora umbrina TaxID=111806 RepID=A0A3D9SMM0_9ACTN|nr:HAMP domain-containing sensor histidine kinase [Thermomonospora umbrina]REE97172.1 signal transduction histidine kinase [Thermomonospora umbrina]
MRRRLRLTVRVRLTALYGAVVLVTGAALLAIVYLLLKTDVEAKNQAIGSLLERPDVTAALKAKAAGKDGQGLFVGVAVVDARNETLDRLLTVSGFALAGLAVTAGLTGWWLAGRVLGPVRTITATARRLSWRDLDRRIAMTGPEDELKELADTFDAMLTRLERAFESQRRFVANASHELRNPLALQRMAIQVGLRTADAERLPDIRADLLSANRRMERLIDGLLLLARSDGGLRRREPLALPEVVAEALDEYRERVAEAGVTLTTDLAEARVLGDGVLVAQLVSNLVDNGLRYNRRGGTVEVRTEPDGTLRVRNTGPPVPADRIATLFQPFTRLPDAETTDGTAHRGAGLGLSIVQAIVTAHDGRVTATGNPDGGLTVTVRLPSARDH